MKLTYLLINLFAISIPLVFSFHPRLRFWQKWRAWLPAIILPAIPFLVWDVFFTRMGVWGFNGNHLLGISLLDLPVEEWLFFFAIPYACLFTYANLKLLMRLRISPSAAGKFSLVLAIGFLIVGTLNSDRFYTGTTSLLTGVSLMVYLWRSKLAFPEYFYPAYVVIFAIPFLLVNGLLTGWGLSEPVVWYNNLENLSLRVITIPVEDFVYGFLLFFLNIIVYEWRSKK
jgi:lycopene cyclase domain-containing protein